ncbi:MAG: hypothetical protein LKJ44_01410 [Bifidobacteriaceae bacterium]|jgi:hypothetical protein|nr:hypothetical protein [Bifidobacteriaceae bacterium]
MPNHINSNKELLLNKGRQGDLIDCDKRTPRTQAGLRLAENGIEVGLSWSDFANNPYMRWFPTGAVYPDDPKKTKYAYKVPRQLWFRDSNGTVTLLGCRAGSTHMLGDGSTNAQIYADKAVLGASIGVDYMKVNGLRSSITGLRQWVGGSSILNTRKPNEHGLVQSSTFTLCSPQDIALSRRGNVKFHYHWKTRNTTDGVELQDLLFVESMYKTRKTWNDLEHKHRAIRDLLCISSWNLHERRVVAVLRADDPDRVESGEAYQDNWCEVISSLADVSPLKRKPNYLIKYEDIKNAGFQAWFNLWTKYSRAIDPLVSSLNLRGAPIEVQLLECGIGLEALGYELYLEDGESKERANRHSFQERLLRISRDLGENWLFDVNEWSEKMAKAYNGIKHANRHPLDFIDNANAWRESVLIFRGWIALRLGISKKELLERVELDPMKSEYIQI